MSEKDVEVGERYLVSWRNGQQHPADIVERRLKRKRRDGEPDNIYEYYVHFVNFDRRLDEWVTSDRINLETIVAGGGSEPDEHLLKSKKSKKRLEELPEGSVREEKEQMLANLEKEHEEVTKVKNIQSIVMGKYEVDTWYFSPYPAEYCGEERLYICEYCLKYMKKYRTLQRHSEKCVLHAPPGKEIYRDNGLCMYEVDGQEHKIYCQNLCLLSKLFLDHKTLYYDVDPFLFYILCEYDQAGSHIVGYFSKEKQSQENYNLACILTFPPYQRKGYGKFLISVSYELTKRENTTGSPEKPLSDLGKISYRSYWAYVILSYMQAHQNDAEMLTIQEIGRATGIRAEDILSTLHSLNMIKYWKGQHVISITNKLLDTYLRQGKISGHSSSNSSSSNNNAPIRLCNPACLNWTPSLEKGPSRKVTLGGK